MSGLEKIIDQIKEEANASAALILREAKDKAAVIEKELSDAIALTEEETNRKCAAAKDDILKKSRSAANMQHQREILKAKQQIIEEMMQSARESLYGLDEKEYFSVIKTMLQKHVRDGAGQIRFNRKDLARFPEGMEEELVKIAKEKGGTLTLDKEPAQIDGGFVLVYGGVEENCSFSSAFATAREALQDKLKDLLFG